MCYTIIRMKKYVQILCIMSYSNLHSAKRKIAMNFKKYIRIIALTLAMIITLCACSGDDTASSDANSSLPYEKTEGEAKVGYIYDRPVSADSYTYMFEKSRKDLETALEVETCYVDNVTVSAFEDAVKALKNEGCNIIVSAYNGFANAAYSTAKKDKEIYILSYGGTAALSNLTCFQPKMYEPAYIGGTVAAYNSKTHKIGIVCDDVMYQSYAVMAAFVFGVQEIYKADETDVKIAYANTKEETEAGVDLLVAENCDVIFFYQPTDHGMYYCDSLGVKSIGFTMDVEYSAKNKGLMGYYLNWATFLTDTVRTCMYNNYESEVYVGGFKEAFVKVTDYTANCKDETDTIADTLYEYVRNGSAKIFVGEIRDNENRPRVGNNKVLSHKEILEVNYLVYGVHGAQNLIKPIETPPVPDLVVKYDFL
ncbi:MAG: BMP family ABC transporter substrate-binding protein [Ruminiclostridium sp.]|nr:BMP family ABC transporter substrate-binding protein [Ruminiclostridium sp.]